MKLSYDDAIYYLEEECGISCDPCLEGEGEYVCDLLDERYDGEDEYGDPYYTKTTLKAIVRDAKEYKKELEEEKEE